MTLEIRTVSPEETKTWGTRLGRLLFPSAVVGLDGDLGAGKTCFVKGLATGLGIDEDEVSSPTFTLIAEHARGRMPLYHVDLYRLEGADVEEIGIEEYLFGQGVAAIEWFRFLPAGIVHEYLLVSLVVANAEERVLALTPHGACYERIVKELQTDRWAGQAC
ncbi:MAG: tRNA (adenosine(37)-N6)-threonylcarbamoyltransferase complex ATPase subunit type 1 TsaE [Deltaproteobacteria bacterium]|nr:tRNA (adenosine(37)-N6)-threonylcarbamoyltransferase complex ATPase subunit type 1 TsaE [Deltaproteobacteria bacterium]